MQHLCYALKDFTRFFFHISDKDENAKQVFFLNGDNADYFSLDSESGDLKTSAHLDREEISIFNLVAHAQDSGMPEWECTSQVIIEINDINDNAPVFDQKGIFLCWQKKSNLKWQFFKAFSEYLNLFKKGHKNMKSPTLSELNFAAGIVNFAIITI